MRTVTHVLVHVPGHATVVDVGVVDRDIIIVIHNADRLYRITIGLG
jgi:hypothetical protein